MKELLCGMNARGAQWHGGIFMKRYTSLKMAVLLHKTALVNFPMATTVPRTCAALLMSLVEYQVLGFRYIRVTEILCKLTNKKF